MPNHSRRSFLKAATAAISTILTTPILPLFAKPTGAWKGIGIPVERASGVRFSKGLRDALQGSVIRIYSGPMPDSADEPGGEPLAVITVGEINEENRREDVWRRTEQNS